MEIDSVTVGLRGVLLCSIWYILKHYDHHSQRPTLMLVRESRPPCLPDPRLSFCCDM